MPCVAVTAGERLHQFLVEHVRSLSDLSARATSLVYVSRRQRVYGDFLSGAVPVVIAARLVAVGKYLSTKEHWKEEYKHEQAITFAREKLDIHGGNCDDQAELARLVFSAARASQIGITGGVRSALKAEFGAPTCYLCGNSLKHSTVDSPSTVTLDHIWPLTFGGDSIQSNLLPACTYCNSAKGRLISWHSGSVFGTVLSHPEVIEQNGTLSVQVAQDRLSKEGKLLLAMRAAWDLAHAKHLSLREAHLQIGPYSKLVSVEDGDDSADFFNLRIHDVAQHGIDWTVS